MRKFASMLLILLLTFSVTFGLYKNPVFGYAITVDGDPGDWLADASAQAINTGMYYATGEYIWKDAENDDVGDGDYTYPTNTTYFGTAKNTADLLEFRVTCDADNLYFLIRLVNVSNAWMQSAGFSVPIVTIHIDQDRVNGSGQEWTAQFMDAKLNSSCWWEYAVVVKGSGSYVFNKNWGNLGSITAKGSEVYDVIEVSVPYSKIGSPIGKTWRFMVYVGLQEFEDYREVDAEASEWHGGGGVGPGTNDWVECDAYDGAFYSSTTVQAEDWSDYDQTAANPTLLCSIPGEGYADIDFTQIIPKEPTARFTFSPLIAIIGQTISFNASKSFDYDGSIVSYTWDFGDGTIVTEADPYITHSYWTAGVYQVKLTVVDNEGFSGSTTCSVPVVQKIVDDAASDFMLRPYQDIKRFFMWTNSTHIGFDVELNGPIPEVGWEHLNIYVAFDNGTAGGNEWFPDYTDVKYPADYEYSWEYCLVIYNLTDVHLLNSSYADIPFSGEVTCTSDNKTVKATMALSSIDNPSKVSVGVVTSEDNGRAKDTIGAASVGTAGWGQWKEISAAITNFLITPGNQDGILDSKADGVAIGKSYHDINMAAYGLNSTHLVVLVTFWNTTGLNNPWIWDGDWRLSLAIDVDHVEASGESWIPFMGGDVKINPSANVTYWEYAVIVDNLESAGIHFYNSTFYDFGAENGTTAVFLEIQQAVAVMIPLMNLPELTAPTLTIISGTDADNQVYDIVGTYTYSYEECPPGAYLITTHPGLVYVPGFHEVSVDAVICWKSIVCQRMSLNVSVTLFNGGDFEETFDVSLYANETLFARISVGLANGEFKTITFEWNTTGFVKGNYTIWAYADPVPGETYITNNTLVNGWVYVTILGDVNADGKVDLKDVFAVALAYGSFPGHPKWNPNLDMNNDNKIDLKDYWTAALNYGKVDP